MKFFLSLIWYLKIFYSLILLKKAHQYMEYIIHIGISLNAYLIYFWDNFHYLSLDWFIIATYNYLGKKKIWKIIGKIIFINLEEIMII